MIYKGIGALPWANHFNGSEFVRKCSSEIALNRLEAHGLEWTVVLLKRL